MSDYPDVIVAEATPQPDAGIVVTATEERRSRFQYLSDTPEVRIDIKHRLLSSADRDSIISHFESNRMQSFNFSHPDGDTYSVRYINKPVARRVSGGWYDVTSSVTGTVVTSG